MTDETKLPKVVPTQETSNALANPDYAGQCHPRLNSGRPGVFIAVPEHIYPLIGVEGGALWGSTDIRVTVLGYMNRRGLVQVSDLDGRSWWEYPDALTPAPKTRTVTLEVEVPIDVHTDSLLVTRRDDPKVEALPRRIVAIDGEEVDDD